MLTEKDYCDYDTCVALEELGYKVPTSAYYMPNNETLYFVSNPYRGGYVIDCFHSHNSLREDVITHNFIDAPTMWEAQKWLREEKGIHITINYIRLEEEDIFMYTLRYIGQTLREGSALYNNEQYSSYEEALSEGIKEAVEVLKDKSINKATNL